LRIDAWVAAALVCALALRLSHLDAAVLWLDETETAIWATLSPDQIVQTVLRRVAFGHYDPKHLPLYFLIINAWTKVVGLSPWLLRLPSVLFSIATVALTASLGQALAGVRAARWAAWLAAISPFLVHHAQEARMYALLSALSTASILLLVRFLSQAGGRLGVVFVLVNIALLLTHYYTVFFIGAELLLLLYLRPRPYHQWWPAWLACALGVALLCYVALFLTTQNSGEIYRTGLFAVPGLLWGMLTGYTLLPSAEELHVAGVAAVWPYMPYAVASVVPVAVLSIAGMLALKPRERGIVLFLLTCVVLGPFVVSAVFPKVSLNPRYFTAAVPLLLVLLGAGMPPRVTAWWRTGAAAFLVGLMGFATASELSNPGQKREDVLGAGLWLDRNVPTEEEILVTSDEMASLAYYHWPDRRTRVYPARNVVASTGNVEAIVQGLTFIGRKRVIYVFGRSWLSDPDHALERAIQERYPTCGRTEVRGIRIYCLLPPV
jgi:uncharacterized membrane protein